MQLIVSKRHNLEDVALAASGAKNALLHLLFATLLTDGDTRFSRAPTTLYDYFGAKDILHYLGSQVTESQTGTIIITPASATPVHSIPIEQTRKTRTSLMLLGSMSKHCGQLEIGYPGGCSFSDRRPFDIHLEGLKALGAKISTDYGRIQIEHHGDQDSCFYLRFPSVGATINLMLYSAIGNAEIRLENIALEPEVIAVSDYLTACGAKLSLDRQKRCLDIKGVSRLHGCSFAIIYDRIQLMSYAAMAYLYGIDITLTGVDSTAYIEAVLTVLDRCGARWHYQPQQQSITFSGRNAQLQATRIDAHPYPGFPTDLQPIFAVMLSLADGISCIKDHVYPERIRYVDELKKMNFPIEIVNGELTIHPLKNPLAHASMQSHDLRAGMACLLAASLCEQSSTISHAEQIFRGYSDLLPNMSHFMQIAIDHESLL
ncbi:MAG: UDP-N-acetylglucosamine 1-carboxyvinyltransferase [Francisellaceae bacterium]